MTPEELGQYEQPWNDKPLQGASRWGKFGEIMPQQKLY